MHEDELWASQIAQESVDRVRRPVSALGLLILGLGNNRLQTMQDVFLLVKDSMLVSLVVDIETHRVQGMTSIAKTNKKAIHPGPLPALRSTRYDIFQLHPWSLYIPGLRTCSAAPQCVLPLLAERHCASPGLANTSCKSMLDMEPYTR